MVTLPHKTENVVTLFGGGGFIGRHIVKKLADKGWRIRVASRKPHLNYHLRTLGVPGQIALVQANIRDRESVEKAVATQGAVINLVGILAPSGAQTFSAVQHEGAATIAEICADKDIRQIVHISAIGADSSSPSAYGKSKGLGEQAVRQACPSTVILRPSLVFGPEDDLFNRFAKMARLSPFLPFVPGGRGIFFPFMSSHKPSFGPASETRFQPVYVGDVADAVVSVLEKPEHAGKTFELGGPEILSFRDMLTRLLDEIHRTKLMIPLGLGVADILAKFLQYVPGAPLTPDQVLMLANDNIVDKAAKAEQRTLEGLGIEAHDLGAILPLYMGQYRPAGEFTRTRRKFNKA